MTLYILDIIPGKFQTDTLKGNGIVVSPLLATVWRSASVLTQIVLVWSLHLYGAGSRANKLYNMADKIRSMHSDEPHKNNMDKEKQRKLVTGRNDSQRILWCRRAKGVLATGFRRIKPELCGPWIPPIVKIVRLTRKLTGP